MTEQRSLEPAYYTPVSAAANLRRSAVVGAALGAVAIVLTGMTRRLRRPFRDFVVHFVQPAAGAAEHFANERFRLSRPFDRPLRDVL